ncbi:portal protein [Clostridium estertheticum]|uniref:portal protein n=1 Tax=Clostridium estertheticum TaxID=238834 RepID=UPI001C7CB9F7|nr:portal protein [Clostridium estertheticum]MBX4265894.1 portal protein [Clostridium estertheticum]WLC90179.1 portal protein [Clostridium estertheticum]
MLNNKHYNTLSNSGQNSGVVAGVINGHIAVTTNVNNLYTIPKNNTNKISSLVSGLIEKLAELSCISDEYVEQVYKIYKSDTIIYDIPKKISYNNIIKYKCIIAEYSKYEGICEEAFNIIDNNNIGIKTKILRNINLYYMEYKGQILLQHRDEDIDEIDVIRENADIIIDNVKDRLQLIINEEDMTQNIFQEDINIGLIIIICYAFVKCKILERPRGET